jgi:hypothetical protein
MQRLKIELLDRFDGDKLQYSRRLRVCHRSGGRVELLKDLKSDLSRLAVLLQPNHVTADSYSSLRSAFDGSFRLNHKAFQSIARKFER